jgi:hypothetical protein
MCVPGDPKQINYYRMKFNIYKRDRHKEVEQLIERYFDGMTSSQEEKQLCKLLQYPEFDGKYEAERAMLGYFKNDKYHSHMAPLQHRLLKIAAVAVIVIVSGLLSLQLLTPEANAAYAYVNGVRITDKSTIQLNALASLDALPSSASLVEESLREVSSRQLIKNQLSVFSDLEE